MFKNSLFRFLKEKESQDPRQEPVPYGISFLDDALDGIYRDDLILISAKTGGGKTELTTGIAHNAARLKKNVHFFALEAHFGEIEKRIMFKKLSQAFYLTNKKPIERPDYRKWIHGKQEHLFIKVLPEVSEEVERECETLNTYYSKKDFDVETFAGEMGKIGLTTDLIILDHLHYFDFDPGNENAAMKKTIKEIKNIVSFYRKPAILVVQLRKSDKYSQQLLPSIDDIHGSSDIAKIATSIIFTAPAKDQVQTDIRLFPTYFKIAKDRLSGDRCYYTGLCNYDIAQNNYKQAYVLGKLINDGTEFKSIQTMEYPQWSTTPSVIFSILNPQEN